MHSMRVLVAASLAQVIVWGPVAEQVSAAGPEPVDVGVDRSAERDTEVNDETTQATPDAGSARPPSRGPACWSSTRWS